MKIAVIPPQLFAINDSLAYGGAEAVIRDECAELAKSKNHDIHLFAPVGSKVDGVTVHETVEPSQSWGNEEWDAYEIYDSELRAFDAVHDHSHQGYPLRNIDYVPTIHTMHGLSTWPGPPLRLKPCLTAISKWHQEQVKQYFGGRLDSRVVHHGVDLSTYKPDPSIRRDGILYLGVFMPSKGHDTLLNIRMKSRDISKYPLTIAGEEKMGDKKLAQHIKDVVTDPKNQPNGQYLGTVSHAEKIKLMQSARAVILPTHAPEAYSLIAVEAMACGTPVIGSNLGSYPELIIPGENGFLIETSNAESYMQTLTQSLKMLHDKSPETWAAQCRRQAEKRFSRRHMAQQFLGLMQDCAEGRTW